MKKFLVKYFGNFNELLGTKEVNTIRMALEYKRYFNGTTWIELFELENGEIKDNLKPVITYKYSVKLNKMYRVE